MSRYVNKGMNVGVMMSSLRIGGLILIFHMMELPIEIFLQLILLARPPNRYEIVLNSYICKQ